MNKLIVNIKKFFGIYPYPTDEDILKAINEATTIVYVGVILPSWFLEKYGYNYEYSLSSIIYSEQYWYEINKTFSEEEILKKFKEKNKND